MDLLMFLVGCVCWRRFVCMAATNTKCRNAKYLGNGDRTHVPDDKVSWTVEWPEYNPVDYTSPSVQAGPVWADPEIRSETVPTSLKFNQLDGKIDRRSHKGQYKLINGVPRNPIGRTGMVGRGLLGKWGPNHAADPIVTRWKRDASGEKVMMKGKPCLEFVAIRRKDNGEWALPGGMVEPGDSVSATLKKEFGEEAMNSLEATNEEKKAIETSINTLFSGGDEVYAGYVDDPRNTDNAWMETVAKNFHDEAGTAVAQVKLAAGDDAGDVQWMEVLANNKLYASHKHFIQEVAERRGAAWEA